MKYLTVLMVFAILAITGSVNAQSASKLDGNTYTYVMKDISGNGEEIIDKITFSNNSVTSEKFGVKGFKSNNVTQRTTSEGSAFEVTLHSSKEGSMKFNGSFGNGHIQGTVIVTDAAGKETTMAFRGMTSENWDNRLKEKENFKKEKGQ